VRAWGENSQGEVRDGDISRVQEREQEQDRAVLGCDGCQIEVTA
jgi:hypothetical protein